MADDHFSRPPRPNTPFARPHTAPRAPQPAGDPLAELARLIGQADPYAGYGQTPPQAAPRNTQGHDPRYAPEEPADWRGAPDSHHARQDPYAQPPRYDDGYGADAPYTPPAGYQDPSYPPSQAAGHGHGDARYDDPRYDDPNYREPHYGEPHYDAHDRGYAGVAHQDHHYAPDHPPHQQPYADPQYSERAHDTRHSDAQHGVPQFASPQFDDKPYPPYDNQFYSRQSPAFPPEQADPYAAHQQAAPDGQGYSDPYYNDPNAPAYGTPYYQHETVPVADAPKRGGLVTVLAVFALAVVGTAGAFGYRAVFAPSGTREPPPVIKADTAPSKIVPANDSAKPIQDRVGDRAQIERILNREEQPVDVNTARAGAPRVVFPGPNPIAPLPNSPIPTSPTPNPAVQASAPTGSTAMSTEPKKIRTVTIRSDQPELASVANTANAAAASRTASVGGVPEDDSRNGGRVQAPTSSGPLSLSPGTAPQPTQRSAPTRTAAVPPATNGGYSVQVTSQRSEGEAQAAYAALQAKFPSVLGSRQAVIRRADLGERGTYYRAQIPFGSHSEAADFCSDLKNAGGQCVIQRN